MNETPMLFPITPTEFWKQIRTTMEEVVSENLRQPSHSSKGAQLPEKVLLKAADVCEIFQVSKPTLYEWLKQDKLKSFKIKSRRYFLRTDVEALIQGQLTPIAPTSNIPF